MSDNNTAIHANVNKDRIDETQKAFQKGASALIPTGAMVAFHENVTPSAREWLLCDGSSFNTTEYNRLYRVIGTDTLPSVTSDHSPENSLVYIKT